jgi:hypothetical protein
MDGREVVTSKSLGPRKYTVAAVMRRSNKALTRCARKGERKVRRTEVNMLNRVVRGRIRRMLSVSDKGARR